MGEFIETKKNSAGNNHNIRKVALVVVTLTSILTPFVGSSINIALPAIGEAFHANAVLLSWVATSYLLAAAVFLVPFGRLADIQGRKKIFALGIATFTFSSFLSPYFKYFFKVGD